MISQNKHVSAVSFFVVVLFVLNITFFRENALEKNTKKRNNVAEE